MDQDELKAQHDTFFAAAYEASDPEHPDDAITAGLLAVWEKHTVPMVRAIIESRARMIRQRGARLQGEVNDKIRRQVHNQLADILERFARRFPADQDKEVQG